MTLNQLIEQLSKNSSLKNFFPLPEPVKTVCETFGLLYGNLKAYQNISDNYVDRFDFAYNSPTAVHFIRYYPENLQSSNDDIIIVQDPTAKFWCYSVFNGWYTNN